MGVAPGFVHFQNPQDAQAVEGTSSLSVTSAPPRPPANLGLLIPQVACRSLQVTLEWRERNEIMSAGMVTFCGHVTNAIHLGLEILSINGTISCLKRGQRPGALTSWSQGTLWPGSAAT